LFLFSLFLAMLRFGVRLVRKLPLVLLWCFMVMCILPVSVIVLGVFFAASLMFGLPSSAITVASLCFSDFLLREILR